MFKHCNWENLVIELLYCWVCIQICSGVLHLHCECASCAVGAVNNNNNNNNYKSIKNIIMIE